MTNDRSPDIRLEEVVKRFDDTVAVDGISLEVRRGSFFALLGFALSIDDFVITYFVAGGEQTFPVFVWGIARVAVPPQVNVVASAIFLFAIGLALANVLWQLRGGRRERGTHA